ncbi:MAG: citrate transporter [Alkalibacterium sp.]|nr:citrate transporter [Alkalibacterium sp.]
MLKKIKQLVWPIAFFITFIASDINVFAQGIDTIEAPSGFNALLALVPLILILVLLFLKVDMIFAGLAGGVIAMLLVGITIPEVNQELLSAIPTMLTITVPIINSVVAMAVFKSGGYSASLELAKRGTKGKVEFVSGFLVILLAAATYMSGIGGGSAIVIAPLAFAAVGVVPELIAGMSLAAAVSFTTSPASLESSVVSELGGFPVTEYVATMRPYTLFFVVAAVLLAFFGTKRRDIGFKKDESEEYSNLSSGKLFVMTLPAIFLLSAVIFGPLLNDVTGMNLINPLVYTVITLLLIVVCTKFNFNETGEAMIDGSSYILTRLFQVGIFLTFINIVAQTGVFTLIANVTQQAPDVIVVPVAVLAGILIGIPAGAYVGSILTLILPVVIALNFSPLAIGLVTMGVGLGSQMSFVNITMQALSSGFQVPILDIVKGNVKWIGLSSVLLLVIAFIFA